MSSKTQKNPSIRFKGFTDAWEQRKLGELMDISSASRVHKNEWTKSGIRFFRSSDVVASFNKKKNTEAFISHELYEKLSSKSGKVCQGDILITGGGSIGIPYLIKDEEPLYFKDADLIWLKNSGKLNGYFLFTYFVTNGFRQYLESISHIGTISHYTIEQAKVTPISLPNKNEQDKIGVFFDKLDNTIALHQRQLNKYNDLKRTMLQKIFPNNHERAPQVRFDGFTGDWERRKFGDLWRKSSERNSDLKYTSLNVLSVAQMKLNPVERNSTDDYMKTYNVLYYGDIAFEGNKSKNYSFGRFVLNDVQDGIVSHVFISFRPKVEMNIDFMKIYINNENVMKHHLVKATTKTLMMTTLNVHDMNKQFLVIPNIDEQAKIGMFFKKLDDNIALHQKKINHYICLKKSFLQGMFV